MNALLPLKAKAIAWRSGWIPDCTPHAFVGSLRMAVMSCQLTVVFAVADVPTPPLVERITARPFERGGSQVPRSGQPALPPVSYAGSSS